MCNACSSLVGVRLVRQISAGTYRVEQTQFSIRELISSRLCVAGVSDECFNVYGWRDVPCAVDDVLLVKQKGKTETSKANENLSTRIRAAPLVVPTSREMDISLFNFGIVHFMISLTA
jgi:hypothetical protein